MKRLLSLALTLALACSLVLPAAAAEQTDARLAAVTARVKATLDLNTDEYTEFYGNLDDNPLYSVWYLEWHGAEGSLSVTAAEDGKIINYYKNSYTPSSASSQFAPAFPAVSREEAEAAALAFLDKVLAEGETAALDENSGAFNLGSTRYRFYGEVLLNGLSADLTFSVSVGCEDGQVLSFYRDDMGTHGVMGETPSPVAAATADQAAAALRSTLALRLEYVLPGEDSAQAVLRYLPERGDDYYVDAVTGELVNLSELNRQASNGIFGAMGGDSGATAESGMTADTAGASPSFSPAEQEGIDKLENALDRETLDAKVRSISALGLDDYTLSTANYTVGREAGEDGSYPVTATLRYGKQVDSYAWRRTATVDALTGELLALYSSGRLPEGTEGTVDAEEARKTAEDFLKDFAPGKFGKTALYDSNEAGDSAYDLSHTFTYAQQENGYFYTGNSFHVGVDSTDGSISSYEKAFDDAVTFDSPEGVISADEAIDAWLDTYQVELQYVMIPAAIDFSQPEYAPLAEYGLSYLYKLALGYELEREDYLVGIDAKTGQSVKPDWAREEDSMAYDDLEGHWAREKIEKLAQYGVGYAGGSFQPDKALTQLDLIALLMSTEGYLYQPDEEESADFLYERAYSLGLLTKEERDDGALLTRAQTVKLILDAVGYGGVAQLEGIFRTGFADDAHIPAAYHGYAALAQGLGMVSSAPGSQFRPGSGALRAEAAVMLYNLMSR